MVGFIKNAECVTKVVFDLALGLHSNFVLFCDLSVFVFPLLSLVVLVVVCFLFFWDKVAHFRSVVAAQTINAIFYKIIITIKHRKL